jgi:DNA-binding LytR/AlgR family response regulator
MKINCIAIDDEPPAITQIESYAKRIPYLNLLKTFNNAIECIEFLKSGNVDLIFLDIEMGDFSGIQLLNSLNKQPKVIFTTAHKQYAQKAFDLDVKDFLVKPISFERFLKAADKVFDLLSIESKSNQYEKNKLVKDYIFVKVNYKMQRVDFKDILYIEGLSEYVIIKTKAGNIITYQSLKNMEEILTNNNFIRVHKSYIVSMDKIISIDKQNLKISDKEIPIGDKYRKKLFEMIENVKG